MKPKTIPANSSRAESSAHKIWKESPAGVEQKELERMFKNGEIKLNDTPKIVREKYQIFQEFSPSIFGAKFRKTKAKFGLNMKNVTEEDEIPELLGNQCVAGSSDRPARDFSPENFEDSVVYVNPPVGRWMYTDHNEKCDIICLAVPIISGATDINFEISEDGHKVSIFYTWPPALFDAMELFDDEINHIDKIRRIDPNHPKIHSYTSSLLDVGITKKSRAKGSIIIPLLTRVQREIGTWKKKPIRKQDGTKIVLLEFKGYQQNTIIKDADTSISFD